MYPFPLDCMSVQSVQRMLFILVLVYCMKFQFIIFDMKKNYLIVYAVYLFI